MASGVGSWRFQVRMPKAWQAAIEAEAERQGKSLSEFARDAMAAQLPADVRKQLPTVVVGRQPRASD